MESENLHANLGPSILAENWIFLPLSTGIVLLRLYSRHISAASFWWDDYMIILSMVLSWVMITMATIAVVNLGFGQHVEVVGATKATSFVKLFLAEEIFYLSIIATAKISIILFFWRVFNFSSMRKMIYVMLAIMVAWWVGAVMFVLLQCRPLYALWTPALLEDPTSGAYCVSFRTSYYSNSIPNIITDWFLLMMPIPYIWRLHVSKMQKIGLICAFALGSITTIVSIARLASITENLSTGLDVTWDFVPVIRWSAAELYLAPTAACFPILGPFARRWFVAKRRRGRNGANNEERPRFFEDRQKVPPFGHVEKLEDAPGKSSEGTPVVVVTQQSVQVPDFHVIMREISTPQK